LLHLLIAATHRGKASDLERRNILRMNKQAQKKQDRKANELLTFVFKAHFLSVERFIAARISHSDKNKGNISRPIVKIAMTGIVLGVAVMLLTVSVVLGFKKEITSKITGLTTDLVISSINVNPSNEPVPIGIQADTLEHIKTLPFVKHIQGAAFKSGILKTDSTNEGILLKGVDKNYDFSFLKANLVEGRIPEFYNDSVSRDILVSQSLADKLGLKIKDKMQIYFIIQREVYDSSANADVLETGHDSRRLKVCGIYKTEFADFDENLALIDLRQIQNLNHWDHNMVGNYEIRLSDFNELDKTKDEIAEIVNYRYNVNTVKELYANVFLWLDKLDINGIVIVVLMILVAVINMITALLILILERTNMVGLLKALGMRNFNVENIFLHISARLIGKGMILGNIVGIGICYLQYYFHIVKLDSATYYVDHVAVDINWLYFLYLNAGTALTCIVMMVLPTLIISKLTPVKTLRFD
jgi:lipoprotein-releasing system permease protein